jgi:ATP-dependent RNA helicase DDX21
MASLLGTSSLFLSPSIELTRTKLNLRPQLLPFRPQLRSLVPLAVVSPNSVNSLLSEEAFKGLGDFSKSRIGEDEEDDFSEDEFLSEMDMEAEEDGGELAGGEGELSIAKLGLPEELVKSLEKRGITDLFPIQVRYASFSLCST